VVLSRHAAPCRPEEVDWHLDVEFALITDELDTTVSPESLDVAWFAIDDLPAELAGDTRHCVDRAVAAARRLQADSMSSNG